MAKFNTVDQVKKEFLLRSNGGEKLQLHGTRYSDLSTYAPIVERLLDTDYNKVSGFSFSELMEAVSLVADNYSTADYYRAIQNDSKAMKVNESEVKGITGEDNFWALNEALNPATTAQAPYPVPSIALTTYQYEKSVLPYLCHQFDLKGNRGLVYYQKITAENAKGNVEAGDLLGSPKELGKQPLDFVGTKNIVKEVIGTVATGETTPTPVESGADKMVLKYHPVQPGSVIIDVGAEHGYFKDFAQEGNPTIAALYSIGGDLGKATINYETGEVNVELTTAPSDSGAEIKATYAREIETTDGGKANMARAQVSLESKQLEAEDFSVFTETSIYQEALSKAIFGLDWNTQVDEALAALYNKEVANKIVSEIEAAIPEDSIATHSINKISGGNNDLFNVQFIAVVMGKLGKMITAASGIGNNKLEALVINVDVLPIMRALPKFTAANNDFEDVMGGMYLAGLYDGMPVIVGFPITDGETTFLGSGEVLGIYKSKTKDFLTPYCWGTFILPIIRDIFDQDNLAVNRKQLIASAAGAVVAERLAAKITITDIDQVI